MNNQLRRGSTPNEIRDRIAQALGLVNGLNDIPFGLLVEATSGYRVVPINVCDNEDIELIKTLDESARRLIKACSNTRRFHGNRINDIGSMMESEVLGEISNRNIKPQQLGRKGYPDSKIIQRSITNRDLLRITYLEIKVSSVDWDGRFRTFYYSNGKKIMEDARHILLGLKVIEESDKYWKAVSYKLIDLSRINVSLKAEYNASNNDIYIKSGGELLINKEGLSYRRI